MNAKSNEFVDLIMQVIPDGIADYLTLIAETMVVVTWVVV